MQSQNNPNFEQAKRAIDNTTRTIEQLIKVQRISNWKINGEDIVQYAVPIYNKSLEEQIEYDLVIFPKFNGNISEKTLANAAYIHTLKDNGRPVTGFININTNINYNKENIDLYLQKILIHEVTHILVFHPGLFKSYLGESKNCTKNKVVNGITRTLLTCPKVVEKAKQYFGCDTIEGLELENQGGEGSVGSHWEARIMLGDYMISTNYQDIVISEITLALFEDSGWYKVNYYTGGLMRFGKGKGCDFLNTPCVVNDETNFTNEFFSLRNQEERVCSATRTSRGYAVLSQYSSELPDEYAYFTNKTYGGWMSADYCPITQVYSNEGSDVYFYSNCYKGNNAYGSFGLNLLRDGNSYIISNFEYPNGPFNSELGGNSFCIESNVLNTNDYTSLSEISLGGQKIYNVYRTYCLPMYCSSESLTIDIGISYIVCPREGGKITVNGYSGYILCPDYNLICTGTVMCNDMYDCVDKQSEPKSGTFDYTKYEGGIKTSQDNTGLDDVDPIVGYELAEDGICVKNCVSCSKTDSKKCTQCRDGYHFVGTDEEDDNHLFCKSQEELIGHYLNSNTNIYYPCMSNCNECTNKTFCLYCISPLIQKNGVCTFPDIEHCSSYRYSNQSACDICDSGYFMLNSNFSVCHSISNIQEYHILQDGTYKKCSNSIENCKTCSSKDACLSCENGYGILSINGIGDYSKCIELNESYYKENNSDLYYSCSEFDENCFKCSEYNKCLECKSGFVYMKLIGENQVKCNIIPSEDIDKYYIDIDNEYKPCYEGIENCERCYGKSKCHKCINGYAIVDDNQNSCVNILSIGDDHFNLNNTHYLKCSSSMPNCLKCQSSQLCLECANNFGIFYIDGIIDNSTCRSVTEYVYRDNNSIYYPCNYFDRYCEKCTAKDICTECMPDSSFIKIKGKDEINCMANSEIDMEKYHLINDSDILWPCSEGYNSIIGCEKCISGDQNYMLCLECEKNLTIVNTNATEKCEYEYNFAYNETYYTPDGGIHYYNCNMGPYATSHCLKCQVEQGTFECILCEQDYVTLDYYPECILRSSLQDIAFQDPVNPNNYLSCRNEIEHCQKCSDKQNCQKCESPFVLIYNEYDSCKNITGKENKYIHMGDGIYQPCSMSYQGCLECYNGECLTCANNYGLLDSNECLSKSDIGSEYYLEDNKYYRCGTGVENCQECESKDKCSRCNPGYALSDNIMSVCKNSSEFVDNNKYYTVDGGIHYLRCGMSVDKCETCENITGTCTLCENGYAFLGIDRSRCVDNTTISNDYYTEDWKFYYPCEDNYVGNCQKCENRTTCIACKEGYGLLDDNITFCHSIYSLNLTSIQISPTSYKSCSSLIPNCSKCSSSSNCVLCASEYAILDDNYSECLPISSLQGKTYIQDDDDEKLFYTCNKKVKNCEECKSSSKCKICQNGYGLVYPMLNCEKLDSLDNKYYIDAEMGTYVPCSNIMNCIECKDKKECIKCVDGFTWDKEKGKCSNMQAEKEFGMWINFGRSLVWLWVVLVISLI